MISPSATAGAPSSCGELDLTPCPDCSLHALVPVQIPLDDRAMTVGACPVCSGVWLDHEPGGPAIADATGTRPPDGHACPRGHGPMHAVGLPELRNVVLDHCPVCRGLWISGVARRRLLGSAKPGTQERLDLARRGLLWVLQILTRLPMEPSNPAVGTPWQLYGLALVLVVFYVASVLGLVYARHYALRPGAVIDDPASAYTLLTHIFFHADWPHLLVNLYFFYLFGRSVEHVFVGRRFLAVFLLAGLIGGLAQSLLAPASSTLVLGASGAIAGIMGAHLWIYPRVRILQLIPFLFVQIELPVWGYLGMWVGCQVIMAASAYAPGMAWHGHIAGFLFGFLVTIWEVPRRRHAVAEQARRSCRSP